MNHDEPSSQSDVKGKFSSDSAAIARSERSSTRAELMLLVATAVWGISFVLARNLGEAGNAVIGEERGGFGPTLVLGIRFLLAAILWGLCLAVWNRVGGRRSRDRAATVVFGSTVGSKRVRWLVGVGVGLLLAIGLVLQHIALDLIRGDRAEAMTAFLTSLTVVFVPLAVWMVWRRWPSRTVAVGIALAVPGVWLMSRVEGSAVDDGSSMRVGIALGVACAFVFSWHLLGVSHASERLGAGRLNAIQFAVVGVACLVAAGVMSVGHPLDGWDFGSLLEARSVFEMLLLILAPTLISFGLMSRYQRDVAPARAALIYMLEPVFAAGFAWMIAGKALGANVLIGAGLILLANVVVELWPYVWRRRDVGSRR